MRLDLCLPEFTSQSSMHIHTHYSQYNSILYGIVNGLRVAEYKPFSVSTFAPFFARLKFHFHRRMAAVSLSVSRLVNVEQIDVLFFTTTSFKVHQLNNVH